MKSAAELPPLGPCPAFVVELEAPPPTASAKVSMVLLAVGEWAASAARSSSIPPTSRRAPSSRASRSATRPSASTTTGPPSTVPSAAASTTCRGRPPSFPGTSPAPAYRAISSARIPSTRSMSSGMVERARRPGAAFIARRPSERAPQVGDLICASRAGSGTTLDNLNRGAGHCDIVVEVKPGWVAAIGGNVGDSVSRSVFPLDGQWVFVAHIRPARFHRDRKQTAVDSPG